MVERLRSGWSRTHPDVTFPTGTALHRGDRTVDNTFAAADAALDAAKSAGRDTDRTEPDEDEREVPAGVSQPTG